MITIPVIGSEKEESITKTIHSEKSANSQTAFAAHLGVTYHYPVEHAAENWKPFITTGIHCDFPTYIPRFLVHFSLELGSIQMKNVLRDKDIKIAYWTFSTSYDFHILSNAFILRPHVGLSSTMITDEPFSAKDPFSILKNTENEHGIFGILEPVYVFRKMAISLPVSADIMFSSPELFITGNIALAIGYNF